MNLQLLSAFVSRKKSWLCVSLALASCNQTTGNNQKSEKSISQISQKVCECFSKQKTGDVDSKMTPCINQVISYQAATLKEGYSYQNSINAVNAVDAMVSKESHKAFEIMNSLVTSCDAFGSEIEVLYDKWYPVDSSSANLNAITLLSEKFRNSAVADTATKRMLHELIARNIKARHLEEGLKRCQQMKNLYKKEGGAYFASAFVYNLQKKYPLAVNELRQEISVNNDSNLELVIGVIKRKARRDKVAIN